MHHDDRRITWQVLPLDDSQTGHAFDASLIFHERPVPPRDATPDVLLRFMHDLSRRGGESYHREAAPFERTMADVPLTLTVRPHAGSPPVRVTVTVFDAAGQPCANGSLQGTCNIVVRTASGTVFASLPDTPPPLARSDDDGGA